MDLIYFISLQQLTAQQESIGFKTRRHKGGDLSHKTEGKFTTKSPFVHTIILQFAFILKNKIKQIAPCR